MNPIQQSLCKNTLDLWLAREYVSLNAILNALLINQLTIVL